MRVLGLNQARQTFTQELYVWAASVYSWIEQWHHHNGVRPQYLILPRDGDTACDKLVIKVVVCGVKVHSFDSGKLLDVQDIFTVHGSRLRMKQMTEEWGVKSRVEKTGKNIWMMKGNLNLKYFWLFFFFLILVSVSWIK